MFSTPTSRAVGMTAFTVGVQLVSTCRGRGRSRVMLLAPTAVTFE
jgi:hypothetical protein